MDIISLCFYSSYGVDVIYLGFCSSCTGVWYFSYATYSLLLMCDPLELFYAWDMMYKYSKCFDHQTINLIANFFFQLFHEDHPYLAISASTICLHVCLLFFVRNLALMQSFLALVKDIDFHKWSILPSSTTIIAKNAPSIPFPVSDDELPFPHTNESWGPHEISLLPQVYKTLNIHIFHTSSSTPTTAFTFHASLLAIDSGMLIFIATHPYSIVATSKGLLLMCGRTRSIHISTTFFIYTKNCNQSILVLTMLQQSLSDVPKILCLS